MKPSDTMAANWWIILLALLGVAVLVTGILYLSNFGMKNMRFLGLLMALYGAIMASIGFAMLLEYGLMGGSMILNLELGLSMLVVALLMISESYFMIRK